MSAAQLAGLLARQANESVVRTAQTTPLSVASLVPTGRIGYEIACASISVVVRSSVPCLVNDTEMVFDPAGAPCTGPQNITPSSAKGYQLWVDRVVAHLPAQDVFDGKRRSRVDVVVGSQAVAGVHDQGRPGGTD